MIRYVINANVFVDADNLRNAIEAVKGRFPQGACTIIAVMQPQEGSHAKVVQFGEDEQ